MIIETDSLGRPIIKYINVRGSDIFDSSEAKGFLPKLMNGLHITTQRGVIMREVLLKPGDPYDSAKAAETARNLRNLGIFRKVKVDSVTTDSGLVLQVYAQDGWSTQVDVRFRSAGSQTDWQLSLSERNLIGTATRFTTRYRHTPDRSLINFQFLQPRLLARTVSLGLRYENRSDGKRGSVAIERPFFSLSDKAGVSTLLDVRNERVIQFRDGIADPSDSLRRRFFLGGWKRPRLWTRAAGATSGSGSVPRSGVTTTPSGPCNRRSRRITGAFGPFIEWRRANFLVTRGFARRAGTRMWMSATWPVSGCSSRPPSWATTREA